MHKEAKRKAVRCRGHWWHRGKTLVVKWLSSKACWSWIIASIWQRDYPSGGFFKKWFLYLRSLILFFKILCLFLNKSSSLKTLLRYKGMTFILEMYFGTYTPLLSLVLKTSEMSRHSKPDSLSFVKKLGLPLSTELENYIWSQCSRLCKALEICPFAWGTIYHQRWLSLFSRK